MLLSEGRRFCYNIAILTDGGQGRHPGCQLDEERCTKGIVQ